MLAAGMDCLFNILLLRAPGATTGHIFQIRIGYKTFHE